MPNFNNQQKKPGMLSRLFTLYLGWESNPHSLELDFESSASTNSATKAFNGGQNYEIFPMYRQKITTFMLLGHKLISKFAPP